ncbi:MAG TPA: polysaccharide deacetylase family protein [Terriglobia bacterium]|nr:polysaccharide deacetylase family protein [Terriglobia bacterium]
MRRLPWKVWIKTIIGGLYYHSGLFSAHLWLRRRRGQELLVLAFHRIVPAESVVIREHLSLRCIVLSAENLSELIRFLKDHFQIVSLQECIRSHSKGPPVSTRCLITFDDGYRDFVSHAWPIVKRSKIPVTMFVPTSLLSTGHSFWWDRVYRAAMTLGERDMAGVGGHAGQLLRKISRTTVASRPSLVYQLIEYLQDWRSADIGRLIEQMGAPDPRLLEQANQLLTWKDVIKLHEEGVSFGSHTRCHPNLKLLSKEEVEREIGHSKVDLETALKTPVQSFAYPGGHRSVEMEQVLERAGYKVAFGTEKGFNSREHDVFWLRRINIWDGMLQNHRGRFSRSAFAFTLMMSR